MLLCRPNVVICWPSEPIFSCLHSFIISSIISRIYRIHRPLVCCKTGSHYKQLALIGNPVSCRTGIDILITLPITFIYPVVTSIILCRGRTSPPRLIRYSSIDRNYNLFIPFLVTLRERLAVVIGGTQGLGIHAGQVQGIGTVSIVRHLHQVFRLLVRIIKRNTQIADTSIRIVLTVYTRG